MSRIVFQPFEGPADERSSDILQDGTVVGSIERMVTYVDSPTSAVPLAIHTAGYAVTLFGSNEDKEFTKLADARAYVRKALKDTIVGRSR